MIFDLLRRLYSDYFRPRATSVSPKIDLGSYSGSFQAGVDFHVAHGMAEIRRELERPGIEPPSSEMPWSEWRRIERELDAPPGWSACRFPTWSPKSGVEICAFVFGIVRGDFGIWQSPFPVCVTDDDGMLTDQREDLLAAVTHLPSGLGMGLFADRDSAVASCTAAEGLGIDWRDVTPNEKQSWHRHFSRMKEAQAFAGLVLCRTRHAHQGSPDGPPLLIWEQRPEAMSEGRPEKLS